MRCLWCARMVLERREVFFSSLRTPHGPGPVREVCLQSDRCNSVRTVQVVKACICEGVDLLFEWSREWGGLCQWEGGRFWEPLRGYQIGTNILPTHHPHHCIRTIVLPGRLIRYLWEAGTSVCRFRYKYHLKRPFLMPYPCLSFHLFCYHTTFCSPFTELAGSVKLHFLFICFLVHFYFPNAHYNVNTVARTLSSLFTIVVPVPRTILDT